MSLLRDDDQNLLLQIARQSVQSHLSGKLPEIPPIASDILTQPSSLFVSIHRQKELRGCIGNIAPAGPLYESVSQCAIAAAVGDPRFAPMTPAELQLVTFEISILSTLEQVDSVEEIQVGTHGLLVTKYLRRGLLLPQVASHFGWNREQFLAETCRKAGLRPEDWKDGATIHRFTAQIFSEQPIHAA